jgi:hypothetical protein
MTQITEKLGIHLTLSFQMLTNVIKSCPDHLRIDQNENESAWKRVLHVLESIDFWFDDFSDYQFYNRFSGLSAEMDTTCGSTLSKEEMLKYHELINVKISNFFASMDDEFLTTNSCKHQNLTYLDIILSQIRPIQINIGYCNEKFNAKGLKGVDWAEYNEKC